jgi:hypothetical protein
MTLFGPAPTAPAPVITRVPEQMPTPVRRPASEAEDSVPLFERRAQLRAKRHKLVAELARDRRTRHSDVNAEVNRAIGIESVGGATIEELERSIDWLDRVLYGR